MSLEQLKYPIGKFVIPKSINSDILNQWISQIATFPSRLKSEVSHLTDHQLDTPYRPDGWTVRQVVHHCADSHMNSFVRLKLTLTEHKPIIKPYHENLWAELPDAKSMPIEHSLLILDGLHHRWTDLLRSLTNQDFHRTFIHPEHGREFPLNVFVALYAWHCEHHLAHITELKKRNNWK